jgi:DNA repair protein RecO (recombination protein O)
MKKTVETPAFVLRRVRYGEADLIVTLLGRDTGKFSAIAKGAVKSTRRFGGSLGTLRSFDVRAVFRPQRDMATLTDATVTRDFPLIEQDFDKITIASYGTELLRETVREGDGGEQAYNLLDQFFVRLSEVDSSPIALRLLLHHLELMVLTLNGARPEFNVCHRCGLSRDAFERLRCSRGGEGLLCDGCRQPGDAVGTVEADTLDAVVYIDRLEGDFPQSATSMTTLQQIRRLVDASLAELLVRPLKSRGLVDEFLDRTAAANTQEVCA